jgi:hypothetical protein
VTRILKIVLATLIALGAAAVLRVYPEMVSEVNTWYSRPDEAPHEWSHSQNRCSLVNIMAQGFEYEPGVADARVIYRRSPSWLWIYAAIVPVFWVATFFGIRGAVVLGRFWMRSLAILLCTRPRRVLTMLAAVSIVCHAVFVVYRWYISGWTPRTSFVLSSLYGVTGAVEEILFPLTFVSRGILWVCHWVNSVLLGWTSPTVAFEVDRMDSLGGALPSGGLAWGVLCIVIMAVVWVMLVRLICDAGAALVRWRRRVRSEARA